MVAEPGSSADGYTCAGEVIKKFGCVGEEAGNGEGPTNESQPLASASLAVMRSWFLFTSIFLTRTSAGKKKERHSFRKYSRTVKPAGSPPTLLLSPIPPFPPARGATAEEPAGWQCDGSETGMGTNIQTTKLSTGKHQSSTPNTTQKKTLQKWADAANLVSAAPTCRPDSDARCRR